MVDYQMEDGEDGQFAAFSTFILHGVLGLFAAISVDENTSHLDDSLVRKFCAETDRDTPVCSRNDIITYEYENHININNFKWKQSLGRPWKYMKLTSTWETSSSAYVKVELKFYFTESLNSIRLQPIGA